MRCEDYTDDAICQSMGMPGFIEPNWSPTTLRLLFTPAFNPFVCLTIESYAGQQQLTVVALADRVAPQSTPIMLPTWREQVPVSESAVVAAVAKFNVALRELLETQFDYVVYDGMGVAGCLLSDDRLEQFTDHYFPPAVERLVAETICWARESCREPKVRDALSTCGNYVGLKLPLEGPLPPAKQWQTISGDEQRARNYLTKQIRRRDAQLDLRPPKRDHQP